MNNERRVPNRKCVHIPIQSFSNFLLHVLCRKYLIASYIITHHENGTLHDFKADFNTLLAFYSSCAVHHHAVVYFVFHIFFPTFPLFSFIFIAKEFLLVKNSKFNNNNNNNKNNNRKN